MHIFFVCHAFVYETVKKVKISQKEYTLEVLIFIAKIYWFWFLTKKMCNFNHTVFVDCYYLTVLSFHLTPKGNPKTFKKQNPHILKD